MWSYCVTLVFCIFFKQNTAYEVRISDWSSDVCSSDLQGRISPPVHRQLQRLRHLRGRHLRRLLILSDGRQKNGKGRSRGAAPFSLEDTIGRRSPPFRGEIRRLASLLASRS